MSPIISLALAALSLSTLTSASCQLQNQLKSKTGKEPSTHLCVPQGAGSWTLAMDVHEIDVPTFDSSAPWAGLVSGNSFMLYDNACNIKGVYAPQSQSNHCGSPYVIEENFLPYVLTIKSVDFDVGSPRFKFAYADGEYSIGENGCACKNVSHGLEGEQACKCAFPLHGQK
ncbi:uncharacterized protein GGS22DRAFT_182980 [Annulohypoxylon maeteangense]|uniref:uncharacterized protein n=1 Tax=Annulohypoxylon maeteangense TaxID=1927788 RepID=UPI00200830E8|nr:uncharacterized protein GGS22DRAFT_182980 [Annulohypoxylon maeteangense]KAI0889635.1 hypothetical protein GGS22DRAFT_182980 [Annulohypoxylon maeteangense]